MQDELLPSHRLFAQPVVEAKSLPALEQLRLALGQSGLHREVGLGQEQGRAPVAPDLRRLGLRCGDCRRWARSLGLASRPWSPSAWPLPWHEPPASSQPLWLSAWRRLSPWSCAPASPMSWWRPWPISAWTRLSRFGGWALRGFGLCRRLHRLRCAAFALAAGLAARFVLARDDALLFLLFAIDPCFPSRPARCPACPRGVLATPPLTIQCCRKERARAENARWGRSFRTS